MAVRYVVKKTIAAAVLPANRMKRQPGRRCSLRDLKVEDVLHRGFDLCALCLPEYGSSKPAGASRSRAAHSSPPRSSKVSAPVAPNPT